MTNFIITGFTPFCGIKENSSEKVVQKLRYVPGVVKSLIIDVSIKAVREIVLQEICSIADKKTIVLHSLSCYRRKQ